MAFTTAQQDRMDKILIEEPDIAVNRLKNIIGSTNWTAVKNYIGVFKREAAPVHSGTPRRIGKIVSKGGPSHKGAKRLRIGICLHAGIAPYEAYGPTYREIIR